MGKKPEERATALLPSGICVILGFAGRKALEECLGRYPGQLSVELVWLHRE